MRKKLHTHFTSNASLIDEKIATFLSSFDCNFQITLDGGRQFHDKTRRFKDGSGSFDLIVDNIKRLVSNGIKVQVRINFTTRNYESIESVLKIFSDFPESLKSYICFDLQRVWQDVPKGKIDETEAAVKELRNKFEKNGFYVYKNHLLRSVRNSCYGDKINHILINYDGKLFGCTARDFNNDNMIGNLNELGEPEFILERLVKRRMAKFASRVCHYCRVAPLCGGGCSQRAMDSVHTDRCPLGYDEDFIDSKILDLVCS